MRMKLFLANLNILNSYSSLLQFTHDLSATVSFSQMSAFLLSRYLLINFIHLHCQPITFLTPSFLFSPFPLFCTNVYSCPHMEAFLCQLQPANPTWLSVPYLTSLFIYLSSLSFLIPPLSQSLFSAFLKPFSQCL